MSQENSKAVLLSDFITKDELDKFFDAWDLAQKNKEPISFKNCFVRYVEQHPMLSQRCIDKGILPAFLGYSLEYIISKQPLPRK
jgi:hypothetical protein